MRPAGVAGMIAVAMKIAEMASAETAAKKRLVVSVVANIVTQFPYLVSPEGQSLRMTNTLQVPCQF